VPDEPVEVTVPRRPAEIARAKRVQPADILRWVVVAVFVGAGGGKLLGLPAMVALFNAVAMGQWLRYAVGICELTGAALLAFRRTALLATFLLSGILIGAAATEMVVLRRLPLKSAATLLMVLIVAMTRLRPAPRE
jgi:putative oxidoreductase